ncbi:MAG: NAD(P)-dependent glycerol-3-phosphate dehydrogenase [Alphaproteobacteria bacterium]|nr:NAD(P)-dependent glycerol-3-phosphate dehydrogenase [Alphaproteobacteria bacterium]
MSQALNNIAVIGAGAWGTALAQVFAEAERHVVLYARDPGLADTINKTGRNDVYLPSVPLNRHIRATAGLAEAVAGAGIVLLVTPTQFVRDLLMKLKPHLAPEMLLVNCAKGIEIASGKLLSEVAAELVPGYAYAVLSGPTFAGEVAKGLPTAVTLATAAPLPQAQHWAQALSSRTFRPYLSPDTVGAEIAGAVKNVIAIACGIVEGKGLGQNAKAAVMTRGMAEIKRLGLKKGATAESFLGLSGIGDLTLTCHSMFSRNYSLGFELGRGQSIEDILASRRTVSEGVTTAKAVADGAKAMGIDMPISLAVNNILHHGATVDDIVKELLSRHLKFESC